MKNKISLTFMKIALIAVALFGSIGVANAQNPFTVTPSSGATWDATSKTLTISGDAATIANTKPEEVVDARILVNANVKSMTLNGVNIQSSEVAGEGNRAVKYLATSGVLALTIEGVNHIKAGGTTGNISMAMYAESSDDTEAGSSINIKGPGTLNLSSAKGLASYGFYSPYGHFVISGGTVNITAGEAAQYNSYGIGSYSGNVTIDGGTVNITAGKGVAGSYAIYTVQGSITINGGSGTAKTTETYAKTKKAFNKKPIGALAPSPWDVKEVSWGATTINSTVSQSISIYPNPAAEVLTIQSESEVSLIEVFDVAGRKQLEWVKGKSVDVGGLNQGNYVVRVQTTDGVFTEKFVKE